MDEHTNSSESNAHSDHSGAEQPRTTRSHAPGRRTLLRGAALTTGAALAVGATGFGTAALLRPPAAPSPDDPVRLGQLASLTGNNPGGTQNLHGAALAVDAINEAGGVLGGRPLELLVADDASSPERALSVVETLLASEVSGIVGTSYSNASLRLIPRIEEAGVPYLSTGAADGQVTPTRPFVFMTPPTGRLIGQEILRHLQDAGTTRIAVIVDTHSDFANGAWEQQQQVLEEHGIEAVDVLPCDLDTEDFLPHLETVGAGEAQALMAWVTGPPAMALAHDLHDHGAGDIPALFAHGVATPEFADAVGDTDQEVLVAASLSVVGEQLPESRTRQLAEDMAEHHRREHSTGPSQYVSDSYTAVRLLAAALEHAGNDDPADLRRSLEEIDPVTPQGRYRYTSADHSGLGPDAVAITTVHDRAFTIHPWSYDRLEHHLA